LEKDIDVLRKLYERKFEANFRAAKNWYALLPVAVFTLADRCTGVLMKLHCFLHRVFLLLLPTHF